MLLFHLNIDAPAGVGPIITGLNSGSNTLAHGQACTISGVRFTVTPGTITLRQGALSQVQSTGVTWADGSIAFTANTTIFAYGLVVLEVSNANGTDQFNVTLIAATGKAYIVANVPWAADDYSVFIGASPAVADGDLLEYDVQTNNGAQVTMFADGTFTIDDDTQGHTFYVRVFDQTDSTWSSLVLVAVNYQPLISFSGPVDVDGTVLLGQVSAVLSGVNFGATRGTVLIGSVEQVVQTWADTAITFIVDTDTPLGTQLLTVTNATTSATVSVRVAAVAGDAPAFVGPSISIGQLTQGTAMTPVSVVGRFVDPVGQVLTYSTVGVWPAGIAVTSTSGSIQGVPTVAGTYNGVAVRVTNADGLFVDSNTFTVTVRAEVVVVPPTPTPDPVVAPPGSSSGINDVAIANLALTKLGEARIISFGDDTKAARAITAIYDITRDAELRRRKWRFSLKRAALPALTSSPEFGYAFAYQLPSDCLSILSVGDIAPGVDMSDYRTGIDMGLYSLEGRQVLTDMGAPLNLRYKSRVTDPSQFDIAFVAALASRLAYELAEDLTQSASKRDQAGADYKAALREAVAANAIEVAPEPMQDNSWLLARQ